MKTITSIKIDKDMKEKAAKLAGEMGISLSTVINASIKQFVAEKRLVLSVEPTLNKKSKEYLREALKEAKAEKDLVGPFSDTKSLKNSLLK